MPPKNKAKNSFFFFMKEMQEKEAARGRIVTMKTIPHLAHPIWVRMNAVERHPYEEMARKYKNDPSLRGGKLASDGTRVEDNLREIEELERRDTRMIVQIQRYVNSILCVEEFKVYASRKIFYFLHFNILCRTETEFIPIEVGVAEYSLQHGIHREFHKILFPGRIPTGYAGEAKANSQTKHEIEVFGPAENSEKDITSVFNGIKRFINPNDEDGFPPLFTSEEELEQTRGCVEWLAFRSRSVDEFKVWNSKYLLLELRAGTGQPLHSLTDASTLLNKASFNYNPGTRCEFHESKDNHYCSLAYSKILGYLLSDAVCPCFDIPVTENHIPPRFSENGYVVTSYNNVPPANRQPVAPTSVRLDKRSNYYENEAVIKDQFADAPTASAPTVPTPTVSEPTNVPRQPNTECMASEMARLKINVTEATAPWLGIGRGQRRIN